MSKNWDPETMGFNKHDYRSIDPDTVNPDDYAKNLRGEEQQFGDVRQYNSAYNQKHPENDLDLDWLGRVGTVFTTEASGFEGIWHVTNMPVVRAPQVYCRAVKVDTPESPPSGEEVMISCTDLGIVADTDNLYPQVSSKLLKRGSVTREQRVRLTKKT
jgi:hypothetical protein